MNTPPHAPDFCQKFLAKLGFYYTEETDNSVYNTFLKGECITL